MFEAMGSDNPQSAWRRLPALAAALVLAVQGMPLAGAAPGPSALSLPQLLTEAKRDNPELRAARKRWEAAKARIPMAKGLPPPKIGLEFEEIPRGSVKFNQATLLYSLIQSIPFPGKLPLKHQVAVKEAAQAAMAFKQAEWDVLTQLKSSYYELFLLDRERETQDEQVLWLKQAVASAQARYAAGTSTQAEVLRVQAELLSASTALTVLAHRRDATAAHLNHLLNRPVHSDVGAPPAIRLEPLPFSPEELVLVAQDSQPELLAFKYAAERAEAQWRLSKRELLPDLETMVELRDPAMGPFGPWDLTLALVLPFWFWTKLHYGVRVAMYDKESAQAAYEAMHNEITRRIHEQWHEAMGAYETAKLCQDGLLALREQAVSSALIVYQSGRGSLMELLDALRALSDQRRTYYEHLVQLEQRVILLEQASGFSLRAAYDGGTS